VQKRGGFNLTVVDTLSAFSAAASATAPATTSGLATSAFVDNICIVGDGADAIALAGLISLSLADCAPGTNFIRLLRGVTPPHIELAGTVDDTVTASNGIADSVASGRAAGSVNRPLSGPASLTNARPMKGARVFADQDIRYALKSRDAEECLDNVGAVIVSGPATAYSAIAAKIAPHLRHGVTIAIAGAPLLGALQFGQALKEHRPDLSANIVELDAMFNHARLTADGVSIYGIRRRVNLSGRSRNEVRRALPLSCVLSPGLLPSSNMLERGFLDAESVVRPVFILSALLGGRIEALSDLSQLLNRSNLSLLAEIEQEISRISFAYQCALADFSRALREESFCQVNFEPEQSGEGQGVDDLSYEATLAEALIGISAEWFRGLPWSHRMAQEVLGRYVSDHLVLLADLARLAKVATPVLDGMISMSSALLGFDLRNHARGLHQLNLNHLSQEDLLELVND
jgi:opine dehydrogenase